MTANPFEHPEYNSTNPFEDSNQIQADVPLTNHAGKAEVGQEYTSYTQYGDNQSSVYQTTGAPSNAVDDAKIAAKAAELKRREEELAAREREIQAAHAEAERVRTQGKNNFPKFYPLIYMYAVFVILLSTLFFPFVLCSLIESGLWLLFFFIIFVVSLTGDHKGQRQRN